MAVEPAAAATSHAAPASSPQQSSAWLALLPLIPIMLWSGNVIVTKVAAGTVHPGVIAFDRWFLAFLLLSPFLALPVWRMRREIAPYLVKLAVLGFLGMAAYQGLAYYAAATTTATKLGFIAALIPLMTMLFSSLLLGEAPSIGMVAGGLVALFGLALLLGHGNPLALFGEGLAIGDGLMFIAVVAYAGYSVLLQRWAIPLPVWISFYMQVVFAVLFQFPLWLISPDQDYTLKAVGLILYASFATSLIAPFVWIEAVARLGSNRTSIFVNLTPVLVTAIAVLALGEPLERYHLVGGAMVLAGVLVTQHLARRRAQRTYTKSRRC